MVGRESERLKEFNPFSIPCIQFALAIYVRQRLVIQMEYKRLGVDVMILMLQSFNNVIELLIIGGVVKS